MRPRRSSTGRTPPACCPWRSGPGSPSVAASTAAAGSAGTTCRPGRSDALRDRLRAEGPLTTTELGGAKKGGEWWDWSESKVGRRVAARHRRRRLRAPRRVAAGVRPRRARDPREPCARPAPAGPTTTAFAGPDDDTCLRELLRGRSASAASARPPTSPTSTASAASVEPRARLERLLAELVEAGEVRPRRRCRGGRARRTPTPRASTRSRPGRSAGARAPRCSRRSTRWSGTAAAPRGCSTSTT